MQVLTSLSGLPFSAASAGFAPTNSADVSAIASAYQVVSSTGTQLHAGTAYLTGVNGAPISASRAGQAANASLSNSAYYDGTGRLISALPDSAAVSAIASSYAESAASGKQDTIEFGYDANNLISSIDGSALAGQGGGGGGSVASPSGTIIVTDGTAIEGTNSAIGIVPGEPEKFLNLAPNSQKINDWYSTVVMGGQSVSGASLMKLQALEYTANPSRVFTVSISGNPIGGGGEIVGTATASSYGSSMEFDFQFDPTWGFGTIWASANPSTIDLDMTDVNALTFYSATTASGVKELAWKDELPTYQYDGSGNISAINGSSLAGQGGVVTATGSAAYNTSSPFSSTGISSINGSALLAVSALSAGSAKSALYATLDGKGQSISACISTVSAHSATWGESGVDSATVSAIASAYVESGVSGKMDSSASSSFYTTANESGFVDSAYVDSAVSGKMDASGMSSYATTAYVESGLSGKENVFDAGDGLEFTTDGQGNRVLQVEAPVDIVAGPGIVIDNPDGNTLRISTEADAETVLFESTNASGDSSGTMSESRLNFEYLLMTISSDANYDHVVIVNSDMTKVSVATLYGAGSNEWFGVRMLLVNISSDNVTFAAAKAGQASFSTNALRYSTTGTYATVKKIVGVHRIANN